MSEAQETAAPSKRETATSLAIELLAFDLKARQHGTSIVDLLATLARTSHGYDCRPTAEEIEAAGLDEDQPEPGETTQEGGAA